MLCKLVLLIDILVYFSFDFFFFRLFSSCFSYSLEKLASQPTHCLAASIIRSILTQNLQCVAEKVSCTAHSVAAKREGRKFCDGQQGANSLCVIHCSALRFIIIDGFRTHQSLLYKKRHVIYLFFSPLTVFTITSTY